MVDLNKCRVSPAGNIITPKARLSFPNLFTAKPFEDGDDKKFFSTSILIPPGADITLLRQAAEKAAKEKFGENPKGKLKSPFLNAGDIASSSDFEGWTLIRTKSLSKPGVVAATGQNVVDESDVYAGRWAAISLRPYAYDHPKGGKGVSFDLQNVQLLDHDDPIGNSKPRAENEFEPVDMPENADGSKKSADSVFG